jgi:hypothetical protein
VTRSSTRTDRRGALATADRNTLTASDEFFFMLEGCSLDANGDRWRIEVCGIHSSRSQHWLQLQLRGPITQSLTVRVPRLDVDYVLTLIRNWLEGSLPVVLESTVTGRAYLAAFTN